jgi:hypothetical protein
LKNHAFSFKKTAFLQTALMKLSIVLANNYALWITHYFFFVTLQKISQHVRKDTSIAG